MGLALRTLDPVRIMSILSTDYVFDCGPIISSRSSEPRLYNGDTGGHIALPEKGEINDK